jgi:hypothetical protein
MLVAGRDWSKSSGSVLHSERQAATCSALPGQHARTQIGRSEQVCKPGVDWLASSRKKSIQYICVATFAAGTVGLTS